MNKLALRIDELQVQSFETALPASRGGTVRAHDGTRDAESGFTQCTGPCDCAWSDTFCPNVCP